MGSKASRAQVELVATDPTTWVAAGASLVAACAAGYTAVAVHQGKGLDRKLLVAAELHEAILELHAAAADMRAGPATEDRIAAYTAAIRAVTTHNEAMPDDTVRSLVTVFRETAQSGVMNGGGSRAVPEAIKTERALLEASAALGAYRRRL